MEHALSFKMVCLLPGIAIGGLGVVRERVALALERPLPCPALLVMDVAGPGQGQRSFALRGTSTFAALLEALGRDGTP
jgi:hypothetical protein